MICMREQLTWLRSRLYTRLRFRIASLAKIALGYGVRNTGGGHANVAVWKSSGEAGRTKNERRR